jgi:hypothetical protein
MMVVVMMRRLITWLRGIAAATTTAWRLVGNDRNGAKAE